MVQLTRFASVQRELFRLRSDDVRPTEASWRTPTDTDEISSVSLGARRAWPQRCAQEGDVRPPRQHQSEADEWTEVVQAVENRRAEVERPLTAYVARFRQPLCGEELNLEAARQRNHLPNVPWLRFAIAHCASTTVCP